MRFFALAIMLLSVLFAGCSASKIQKVERYPTSATQRDVLYHTLDGVYAALNDMKQAHPQLVHLFILGYSEKFHHPIPMLQVQSDAGDYPAYLVVAGTHGDEAAGVEAVLYSIEQILQLVEKDPSVLVGKRLCFAPLHNPDGFAENQRENGAGVDLNRNFPFGFEHITPQAENKALINFINSTPIERSLFFHSANERKYENIIRVPIELGKGKYRLAAKAVAKTNDLVQKLEKAGTDLGSEPPWRHANDMVDVSGIASDWAVAPWLENDPDHLLQKRNKHPHVSLTIELCTPKQPMSAEKLLREKQEAFALVYAFIDAKRGANLE